MIEESVITSKLVEALAGLFEENEVTVADALDFSEQRSDAMLVVGCQSREQMNAGLDDYRWSYRILIDVRILQDQDIRSGESIRAIQAKASEWLSALAVRGYGGIPAVFGGLPVVGVLVKPAQWSLAESSNRVVLPFDIITSE